MYPLDYMFYINQKKYKVLAINFVIETVVIHDKQIGQNIEYPMKSGVLLPYTGVVDSNNRKLYVGDIVQVTPMLVENIPTYTATIVWDKYRFALHKEQSKPGTPFMPPYSNLDSFGLHLVWIGSIHEDETLRS